MCAPGALAAPKAPALLPTGQVALPPEAFVDFCRRQPEDCGPDREAVLAGARRAQMVRRELLALPLPATASVGEASDAGHGSASPALTPMAAPLSALVERAEAPRPVAFIDPSAAARSPAVERLTPALWSRLNRINTQVNGALRQQKDLESSGQEDYWATPLKTGGAVGDCEDFVLEKRRALLDAGVSPRALNIAVVTTRWGETHAVLLVATHKGEFVLDNLSSWVTPWREAPYRWRQRQVNGEAFTWAMAAPDQGAAGPRNGRLLLAAAR